MLFPVNSQDKFWAEAGISAKFNSGPAQFGIGVDTTIARDNANAQTYRASATFKF